MKDKAKSRQLAAPPHQAEPDLAILREKTEALICQLVEPVVTKLGYELVRVQLAGARGGLTLQLMADRADGKAMVVEDCRIITHGVDLLLDEADPIPGAYALEVSSPGIDRPLTREKDFVNWAGFEAKISLHAPYEGRKNFRGFLRGIIDGLVHMELEDALAVTLPYAGIAKAQLVLSDELIAATAAREAAAAGIELTTSPVAQPKRSLKPKVKPEPKKKLAKEPKPIGKSKLGLKAGTQKQDKKNED
jgi:ribosome maturation factor RimP